MLTFLTQPGSLLQPPASPSPWALGRRELLGLGTLFEAPFLLLLGVIPRAPCSEEFRTCCGYLWSTLSLGDGGLHSSEKAAFAYRQCCRAINIQAQELHEEAECGLPWPQDFSAMDTGLFYSSPANALAIRLLPQPPLTQHRQ